jgi:putative lantibiotic ABC-transport system integral membrane protein
MARSDVRRRDCRNDGGRGAARELVVGRHAVLDLVARRRRVEADRSTRLRHHERGELRGRLRNSATALGLYISIILIAPIIIGQIPVDTAREIAKWLPNNVFNFLTTNAPNVTATLNYPLLIATAIAYPLAILTIGFLRLRRRVI